MIKRIWAVTLTVSDIERAVDFYADTLGLQMKYRFKDYAGFDCGGVELGLKTWGGCEKFRRGEPCIDLMVDNIQDATARLKDEGVDFAPEAPLDAAWGALIAPFKDPDGNCLQLTQIDWKRYFAAVNA